MSVLFVSEIFFYVLDVHMHMHYYTEWFDTKFADKWHSRGTAKRLRKFNLLDVKAFIVVLLTFSGYY